MKHEHRGARGHTVHAAKIGSARTRSCRVLPYSTDGHVITFIIISRWDVILLNLLSEFLLSVMSVYAGNYVYANLPGVTPADRKL